MGGLERNGVLALERAKRKLIGQFRHSIGLRWFLFRLVTGQFQLASLTPTGLCWLLTLITIGQFQLASLTPIGLCWLLTLITIGQFHLASLALHWSVMAPYSACHCSASAGFSYSSSAQHYIGFMASQLICHWR